MMRFSCENRCERFYTIAMEWFSKNIHTDLTVRCGGKKQGSTLQNHQNVSSDDGVVLCLDSSTKHEDMKPFGNMKDVNPDVLDWGGVPTDCGTIFQCHKIIVMNMFANQFGVDDLDCVDEILLPDVEPSEFVNFIRCAYGFDSNLDMSKMEPYFQQCFETPHIKIDGSPITLTREVKLEADGEIDDDGESYENPTQYLSVETMDVQDKQEKDPLQEVGEPDADSNLTHAMLMNLVKRPRPPRILACPCCGKVFNKHHHLTRHITVHSGAKPYECLLCQKGFTRREKLVRHYKQVHGRSAKEVEAQRNKMEQMVMDNATDVKMEVDNGALNEIDNVNVNVDKWEQTDIIEVSQVDSLKKEAVETDESDGGLLDPIDVKMEPRVPSPPPPAAQPARRNKPKAPAGSIRKSVKKEVVIEEDDDEEKNLVVEEKPKRSYPCKYCSQNFSSFKIRKNHFLEVHREELEEKGMLFKHNKNISIKIHSCPYEDCNRVFRHLCEKNDHVNVVHKNEKNYVCELCSKAFPYRRSLRNHMELKHEVSKNREEILCPDCGEVFTSKLKLSNHITAKHKVKVMKFQCKYCDFKTHAKNVILEHERTHTGEKPEICQWCGKGFNAKKTLRNHERLHTGEKPYQCLHCTHSFAQRTSLNVHMAAHHKGEKPVSSPIKNRERHLANGISKLATVSEPSSDASNSHHATSENDNAQQDIKDVDIASNNLPPLIDKHYFNQGGFSPNSIASYQLYLSQLKDKKKVDDLDY